MIVAISVATALYVAALFLHPRILGKRHQASPVSSAVLLTCLAGSMWTVYRIPAVVGTSQFLPTLLRMHVLLVLPFIQIPRQLHKADLVKQTATPEATEPLFSESTLYRVLAMCGYLIVITNTVALYPFKSGGTKGIRAMFDSAFIHPAQASISMDVLWVAFTAAVWYLLSGKMIQIVAKFAVLATSGVGALLYRYGVNWQILFSAMPVLGLLSFGLVYLAISRLRSRNQEKRKALLDKLGVRENTIEPGTKKQPPTMVGRQLVVGFWHPYW